MPDEHMEGRGQLAGLGSLHLQCGFWGLNASFLQTWLQVPFRGKPNHHQPQAILLSSAKFKPIVIRLLAVWRMLEPVRSWGGEAP